MNKAAFHVVGIKDEDAARHVFTVHYLMLCVLFSMTTTTMMMVRLGVDENFQVESCGCHSKVNV